MRVLISKFNDAAIDSVKKLPKEYSIYSVCDPDIGGRVYAQHIFPGIKSYADIGVAIQDCDAVLISISDYATPIAFLAMAYKKKVILSSGVSFGSSGAKVTALAAKTFSVIERLND